MHASGARGWAFNWWGLFMLAFGSLWLLKEMGLVDFQWRWVGPIALVVLGLSMLFGGCGWGGREREETWTQQAHER